MDVQDLCPSASLAIECERRFQANMQALRRVAPEVADRAADTVLVITYLALGRDGSVACRIETPDGDRRWVGGTVIPQWAAAQMIATLDLPPVGHLLLAPFDGGHGLKALLAATYEHQHIFVLEEDPCLFAATLMITDLREAFASGRLRLFVGSDLGEQVAEYVRAHPWYGAPQHLITTSTEPEIVARYRDEVRLAERLVQAHRAGPGLSHAA